MALKKELQMNESLSLRRVARPSSSAGVNKVLRRSAGGWLYRQRCLNFAGEMKRVLNHQDYSLPPLRT